MSSQRIFILSKFKKGWLGPIQPSSRLSGGTVSRFLFYPVIYLRNLPPDKSGSLFLLCHDDKAMSVYMVLQALVPSPSCVATGRRELLPRGFTLTLAGGLFSVTASIRLLPSVLSTAGYPFLSGLSSAGKPAATGHPTLFLFISELSLHGIIFSIQPFHFSAQGRSYVFAMLMALH